MKKTFLNAAAYLANRKLEDPDAFACNAIHLFDETGDAHRWFVSTFRPEGVEAGDPWFDHEEYKESPKQLSPYRRSTPAGQNERIVALCLAAVACESI